MKGFVCFYVILLSFRNFSMSNIEKHIDCDVTMLYTIVFLLNCVDGQDAWMHGCTDY